MKAKRHLIRLRGWAALLIALALLMPVRPALAASNSVSTRILASGFKELKPVERSRYILAQTTDTGLWGVINSGGRKVIDYQFSNLAYVGNGCFVTENSEEPLDNQKALVAGKMVSDPMYGVIISYNEYWAAGWVITAANEEVYDYSPSKKFFYNIKYCDLFYLGGEPELVASYTRQEFASAKAHGQYISVQDRDGGVTVLGPGGEMTNLRLARVTDTVYGVANAALMNKVTREIIIDGISEAKEFNTRRGLLLQVSRADFSGNKLTGICNIKGEWLLPLGDNVIKQVSDDYVILTENDRLGLYSFELKRMVVPCAYDSIVANKKAYDPFSFYGYACAVRDGVRDYINMRTGEVCLSVPEKQEKQKILGSAVIISTGRTSCNVYSASGAEWKLRWKTVIDTRGDGRFVVVRNVEDNKYGVYSMDGQVLLETKYRICPVITDDGLVILQATKDEYQLMLIVF